MVIYDQEIFKKFKALSIQHVSELKVGDTIYSNLTPTMGVIAKLQTHAEHYADEGLETSDTNPEIRWVIFEDGSAESLNDRNVTNSYNPWMFFKDKETMLKCREELKVGFTPEPYDD
ncbi:hypothetical protein HYP99_gp013 [Sinorhizobium phage ort11]|uniref:Uncharacterized protein n=1 Tax=Sinorhizobium phage ort11 TaxID=2599764 RepID=A0A5C2H714_9CAUD|nr:hypothetical protein HYP99_gp013 [Sinorhizobium phage ort11]QEP29811.1 hypothetical protein Smphiort11_013 [Sinorhizobium phage ort11]